MFRQVTYNAENRPVSWTRASDGTNIEMLFDRMGRRVEYVERTGPVTNRHHRFVYDGYLCVQRLDALANNLVELSFAWDPTEPVATRPLVLQRSGGYNLFYTHDGNKNVSELVFFQQANGIAAHYEYAPFGAVTATSRSTPVTAYDFSEYNPLRFSAEYSDITLSQCCYTYRNYNTLNGRWCSRDSIEERGGVNLYAFVKNRTLDKIDTLGQYSCSCSKEEMCKTAYGVGPYDAYKAKKLSDEAFRVARSAKDKNGQKLPDPHNGRQDAFRHCYWSCRMVQELSKEEAKIVGDNHEVCAQGQLQAEKEMDEYNNKMGRDAPKNTDCKTYCLDLLEHGKLIITLK